MGQKTDALRALEKLKKRPTSAAQLRQPMRLSPYEQAAARTSLEVLREVLETLCRREKAVLRHRFGLNGRQPKGLGAVGKRLGITHERVRQIHSEAIVKLRRRIKRLWYPAQ